MLERDENDRQIKEIWEYVQSVAVTERDALDIFFDALEHAGDAVCRRCRSRKIKRASGSRKYECEACGEITWFTSNILLSKVRRFKAYLAAVLIFGQGLHISGSGLAKLTGVVPGTGLNIERKFNMALANQMPEEAARFSGQLLKRIIAKRTTETLARLHPYTEQEIIDQELEEAAPPGEEEEEEQFKNDFWQGEELEEKIVEAATTNNIELIKNVILSLLSDIGITADTISERTSISIGLISAGLIQLQLDGKIIEEKGFGQRYVRFAEKSKEQNSDDPELYNRILKACSNFREMVSEYCHRVGRKGLQLRLAGEWAAQDRKRWDIGAMMQLCLTHPPVTYRDILNYISPPLLSIMLH